MSKLTTVQATTQARDRLKLIAERENRSMAAQLEWMVDDRLKKKHKDIYQKLKVKNNH